MDIVIGRPRKDDVEEINRLFSTVITHNFKDYGFYEKFQEDLRYEIGKNIDALQKDFGSNGKEVYFLIARDGDRIVGTIAYGEANNDIKQYYKPNLKDCPEIKSVYVLPNYQGKGIGTKLLNEMVKTLQNHGYKEFCLDSGYPKAQQFWTKKFGAPIKTVTNRWGAGNDYMIWHKKL